MSEDLTATASAASDPDLYDAALGVAPSAGVGELRPTILKFGGFIGPTFDP